MMNTIKLEVKQDKKDGKKSTLEFKIDGNYWEIESLHSSIEIYLRDRAADKGVYPWNTKGMKK